MHCIKKSKMEGIYLMNYKMYKFSNSKRLRKRIFDIIFSFLGLLTLWWLILIPFIISTFIHGENGFFIQTRIGRFGKKFKILKIKTMKTNRNINTIITTSLDPRITRFGMFLRLTKVDELPQLINILIGDMSFVGPRPDVQGFADKLEGKDRLILELRPGITGPASLHYKNEETILANKSDPENYNKLVLWPTKVKLNLDYALKHTLINDIKIIIRTILSF